MWVDCVAVASAVVPSMVAAASVAVASADMAVTAIRRRLPPARSEIPLNLREQFTPDSAVSLASAGMARRRSPLRPTLERARTISPGSGVTAPIPCWAITDPPRVAIARRLSGRWRSRRGSFRVGMPRICRLTANPDDGGWACASRGAERRKAAAGFGPTAFRSDADQGRANARKASRGRETKRETAAFATRLSRKPFDRPSARFLA